MASQNTLTFQKSSPVQALTGLARQIALPHDHAPQRYPSFPALERTAVMSFNANATLAISSVASDSTKILVTRQAAFPVWAEYFGSTRDGYSVSFGVTPAEQLTTATVPVAPCTISDGPVWWTSGPVAASATLIGSNAILPNFTYPLLGLDASSGNTRPYVYVPSGFSYIFAVSCSQIVDPLDACDFSIRYSRWTAPGQSFLEPTAYELTINSGNRGGAGSSITVAEAVWIRIEDVDQRGGSTFDLEGLQVTIGVATGVQSFIPSPTTRGTFQTTNVTRLSLLPIAYPVEFTNSALPWYSTRTTATAALFTNVTQVLNKGGTVLAGRVPPQVVNPFTVTRTYIGTLHPAEKNYLGLETGFYTFVPPSTDMADFLDYTLDTSQGAASCPLYRLDNTSLVNVAFFNSAGATETLAVNADWHVEFRTTSALFQVGMSALTLESFHQAQLALSTIGFFFPNEQHKSLLSRVIAAAGRFARSAFPTAVSMVPYANAALKAGSILHDVIAPRKPPKVIPPSSAERSGITTKPTTNRKRNKKVKVKRPKRN